MCIFGEACRLATKILGWRCVLSDSKRRCAQPLPLPPFLCVRQKKKKMQNRTRQNRWPFAGFLFVQNLSALVLFVRHSFVRLLLRCRWQWPYCTRTKKVNSWLLSPLRPRAYTCGRRICPPAHPFGRADRFLGRPFFLHSIDARNRARLFDGT